MRKPKPRQIFITVGSRSDLQLLFYCARTGTPVDWTVPKEAEIGEKVYFVVPSRVGPVRAFGFVDDIPYFSDDFGGTYRTTVVGIELLEVPVPLDEIAEHFKSWPYWGNVKRYSTVPPEYANDFVRFIENFQSVPDWKLLDVIESTERILGELGEIEEPPEGGGISTPDVKIDGSEDFEERIPVSIKRRRGQANFRNSLRGAYNDTCAITKCNSHHALEAAHISPYRNISSNSITNGILLRADIHSLFDLNLIAIDENEKITLSELIRKTPSGEKTSYDYLHGQLAKLPVREEHYPDKVALRERFKQLRP